VRIGFISLLLDTIKRYNIEIVDILLSVVEASSLFSLAKCLLSLPPQSNSFAPLTPSNRSVSRYSVKI
jgi:hypothetical protein